MNKLENELITEYCRLTKEEREITREKNGLPMGYIQEKTIKGRSYFYLQHREGKTVKSEYIKRENLDEIRKDIEKRKQLDFVIEGLSGRRLLIEGMINKDILNVMYIKQGVCRVIKNYQEITRIALFGSRAGSGYREDSDVDLIFESSVPVPLMKQAEIRLKIEEELGMPVDLVHGPLSESDFLRIDKEIELYVA